MEKREQEEYRYERKFLITGHSHKDIENILKLHPAAFSEVFSRRTVNNIYFDSLGLDNYYDNLDGAPDREKMRIRWYGELFGVNTAPILEYKIKKKLLGKKNSYPLLPFEVGNNLSRESIRNALIFAPEEVKRQLMSVYPVLLNSYSRNYFMSADKKFRVTIDINLSFYRIGYGRNLFLNKLVDKESVVMELKYDHSSEEEANEVASEFPFPLSKNSKYQRGIQAVYDCGIV
ncbi:MAG: VTC domain-containing protein [Bacteroidia bacterium]